MPEYDRIKISTTEYPRVLRSQSFSHHYRPHRTRARCPENCACVTVDAWNDLVEGERMTLENNESLKRENRSLKTDYRVIYQDNRRLQGSNRDLQAEVDQLKGRYTRDEDSTPKLRRRVAALKAERDGKDLALDELKEENKLLRREKEIADTRVRELTQTVKDEGTRIDQLRDDMARVHQIRKQDQEDIKYAWGLVDKLQRRLREYRDPFSFRRYDVG
ncbi:hypothetical protein F5X98DRAFT_213262 [Xylaria grammica]|nr:hypothetical protein F5X98DRAFT_213262 [Xylaria grammica]